jgi:general stress protein YciG
MQDYEADDFNDVTAEHNGSTAKAAERPAKAPARRGFAAMDQQTQREIASKGGHSQGKENNRGNFWHDRERIAGRKGGEAHGKNRLQVPGSNERH